ncbi:hypothetical protein DCO17_01670 [Polynucleobacter tropicus]|uniref:O-antigen ligase-related domain-containing protein n=1 Tax=Polynucleobacter tropicus TaxID=1743174 RepID=A0A6M9PTS4_9BURK|nr:O-antigen ligase family protein [Polynucleobacter tropicus]QKM64049.1 hypothetical protein DCO17_01670 [Polynucleobacter tropicus]
MEKIKNGYSSGFIAAIAALCLLSYELFFTFCALIGYTYPGSNSSPIFKIYAGVLFLIAIMIFLKNNSKLSLNFCLILQERILILPFLICGAYIFSVIDRGSINKTAELYILYYLVFSLPALIMGILIGRLSLIDYFIKIIDLFVFIASIAIFKSYIFGYLFGHRFSNFGGVDYQSASYISAIFFGLNLYFVLFLKEGRYKYFRILMGTILFLGVLIPEGRGGFLLMILYIIFFVISYIYLGVKKINPKKNSYIFLAIIFIAPILAVGFNKLDNSGRGLKRALEYLEYNDHHKSEAKPTPPHNDSDAGDKGKLEEGDVKILDAANAINAPIHPWLKMTGINWSGTSNRGALYSNTIRLIIERPFFGYGLFGFWDISGYPHNIELEIFLQGGIFYFSLAVIFFFYFAKNLYKLISLDSKNLIILIIFMLPLVRLHVSGTYISEASLWFCIGLAFSRPDLGRS